MENFRETPQNVLLDQGIWPILERIHPDRHFALGHDCGIYWRLTDPLERGAICPDWFYVPGVPPDLDGHYRRSYVLWKEHVPPAVMIEYASEDGSKERDRTPYEGKFWIYEQAVRGGYYAIFVVETGELEVHRLEGTARIGGCNPTSAGITRSSRLGVELGVWHGFFGNETAPWLRWYDTQGNLLPIGEERAEQERRRAEQSDAAPTNSADEAEEQRAEACRRTATPRRSARRQAARAGHRPGEARLRHRHRLGVDR